MDSLGIVPVPALWDAAAVPAGSADRAPQLLAEVFAQYLVRELWTTAQAPASEGDGWSADSQWGGLIALGLGRALGAGQLGLGRMVYEQLTGGTTHD